MRTVRNIVNTGRTIVCTIHQPSIDIFESFDELLLLKRGGQTIYAGHTIHSLLAEAAFHSVCPGCIDVLPLRWLCWLLLLLLLAWSVNSILHGCGLYKALSSLVLCRAVLYCACAVLCRAVPCCAVLCCAVLCCAVLCCAVLCCAVLCCAVLCCAVLFHRAVCPPLLINLWDLHLLLSFLVTPVNKHSFNLVATTVHRAFGQEFSGPDQLL